VTFPTNLSEKDEALRAEVYWEEFSNWKIEKFAEAVKEAISSCRFFPKPSELREFFVRPAWKTEMEYLEKSAQDFLKLPWISQERAEEILSNVKESDDYKKIMEETESKPTIQDEEKAKEFEHKRLIAKEKAQKILN
jgi:hypothetical protein